MLPRRGLCQTAHPSMLPPTVTVTQKGAARARAGHPWIFRADVAEAPGGLVSGAEVRLADARGNFIARGFWAVKSPIALRVLSRQDTALDEELLASRRRAGAGRSAGRVLLPRWLLAPARAPREARPRHRSGRRRRTAHPRERRAQRAAQRRGPRSERGRSAALARQRGAQVRHRGARSAGVRQTQRGTAGGAARVPRDQLSRRPPAGAGWAARHLLLLGPGDERAVRRGGRLGFAGGETAAAASRAPGRIARSPASARGARDGVPESVVCRRAVGDGKSRVPRQA